MKKISNLLIKKKESHYKRKKRVNSKLKQVTDLPRLIVNKSNLYTYAQVVDKKGKVLASSNDVKKSQKDSKAKRASEIGKDIAEKLKKQGIEKIAFDRNGYKYHGRLKELADAARDGGLQF